MTFTTKTALIEPLRKHPMSTFEAKQKAFKLWGKGTWGEIRRDDALSFTIAEKDYIGRATYRLGLELPGARLVMGKGRTWEEAFEQAGLLF